MKVLDFLQAPLPEAARIFVISGADSYLRRQAVEHVLASLNPDVEVQTLYGQSTVDRDGVELGELLDDLRMQSLFGDERLLHVKRADQLLSDNKQALKRFIEAGEAVHRLILEGEALAPKTMRAKPKTGLLGAVVGTGGLVVLCAPLYDTSFSGRGPVWKSPLSSWVVQRARGLDKEMSLENAWVLHRLVGAELEALDQELVKLSLFVGDRSQITAEDIEHLVAGGRMAPVYALAEACGCRDLPASAEQSELLFTRGTTDGSGRSIRDPAALANMLLRAVGNRLQKIFLVRELLERGETFESAADQMRETPWGRERLRAQVEAFKSPRHQRRILGALLELERGLKSGGGPPRVLFDRFLVTGIGSPRVSGAGP